MLYVHDVITEEALSGQKLTGTIAGTFTSGETVTGGTSGATGELAYAGATYIRVRKVSGTFTTGETATGGSSSATCSTITAVADETAGGGRFLTQDAIDTRNWDVIPSYAPKLKLNENTYSVNEDLYLRIEGQGSQDVVSADTDLIYLPPDWLVQKAITYLPQNKIQANHLDEVYRRALLISTREPHNPPNPFSKQVTE